jgi:tetratricopeptide (TPR) repeat protein
MQTPTFRSLLLAAGLATLIPPSAFATCGGGGGGGLGGGGFPTGTGGTETYQVPWRLVPKGGQPQPGELVLLWFPSSPEEARGSGLQTSRNLSLWSSRCVSMTIVPTDDESYHRQYEAAARTAVLAGKDGKEIARATGGDRDLRPGEVEKMVSAALKAREEAADRKLDEAEAKAKAGDADGAAALYTEIWTERCLLPSLAKKASKALKKLGRPVPDDQARLLEMEEPVFGEPVASEIVALMNAGLAAEQAGRYLEAKALYEKASRLDPADAVPLRFLGELARHHTGEWGLAHEIFHRLLAMPADPLSRAVALHGLGKMTIHGGQFAKGLAMFEQSVAVYPLALAYRNLAVYWNSERQPDKARVYVDKALALDPEEPFNLVFAATYLAEQGRSAEALAVAKKHEDLLAASYNLAAIYALAGNRDMALSLLRRHFYAFEQFDAVRAMEMKEAREDIVFLSLRQDSEFVALTALAAPSHGM